MLDVRLISVIPAQPSVAQPGSAPNVTTQGGVPLLPQLPNGTVLSGFILNRDGQGNPVLRTETGDVVFSSNLFLKIGSEVVLRLQNNAGKQTAHLVSVNGQTPEIGVGQSAFIDEPDVIVGGKQQITREQAQNPPQAANQTQQQNAALPKIGATISAIVTTPSFTPNQPASVTPGTNLLLSVLGYSLPAAQPTPNAALSQLTTPQQTAPGQALASLLPDAPEQAPQQAVQTTIPTSPQTQTTTIATIPNAPTTVGTPQHQQQPLTPNLPNTPPSAITVPSVISNQQAATSNLAGPLGQTLLAAVVAGSQDGSMTLQTPLGQMRVANMPTLPIGQPLALRVNSVAEPNSYTLSVVNHAEPMPAAPLTELARSWASLQHITQLMSAENMEFAIPTFPTSLSPAGNVPGQITQSASHILFFIAALKGGSLREWLGAGNIKSLEEKGYSPLIRKAEAEFMQIARQFVDAQPGQWQTAFIPVMAGQELMQLRAFIKREKKKDRDGQTAGDEDTRFVLEMNLSQLGEMQMDGLVKRREERLQFDLVIRSLTSLPPDLKHDIQTIYSSTAELTGFRGQLTFQDVSEFPVHPMEDIVPHAKDVVV